MGIKVSIISIVLNILLSVGKFIAGVIGNSVAMVSDAVHSASDVVSSLIVIVGLKISEKEADEHHPYGHEKMECIAAILLAGVLAGTGASIGYSGIKDLIDGTYSNPSNLALIAAGVSIVVKEGMYWYTRIVAKKIKSSSLMADAWHHRTDALSSVGALIGILGAQHGLPFMDSLASIVIGVLIIIAAYGIFKDAMDKLVDHVADNEDEIRQFIEERESLHLLQTRQFGGKIYVDVELGMDGRISLTESHDRAEKLHDEIEEAFEDVKHVMIHVNPEYSDE